MLYCYHYCRYYYLVSSIVLRRRLTDVAPAAAWRDRTGPDRGPAIGTGRASRRRPPRGRYVSTKPAAEAPPFAALGTRRRLAAVRACCRSPGGRVGGNIGSVVWVRRGVVVSSLQSSVRRVVLHGVLAAAPALQRTTTFRLHVTTLQRYYIHDRHSLVPII